VNIQSSAHRQPSLRDNLSLRRRRQSFCNHPKSHLRPSTCSAHVWLSRARYDTTSAQRCGLCCGLQAVLLPTATAAARQVQHVVLATVWLQHFERVSRAPVLQTLRHKNYTNRYTICFTPAVPHRGRYDASSPSLPIPCALAIKSSAWHGLFPHLTFSSHSLPPPSAPFLHTSPFFATSFHFQHDVPHPSSCSRALRRRGRSLRRARLYPR
jgi:hypothetical protein